MLHMWKVHIGEPEKGSVISPPHLCFCVAHSRCCSLKMRRQPWWVWTPPWPTPCRYAAWATPCAHSARGAASTMSPQVGALSTGSPAFLRLLQQTLGLIVGSLSELTAAPDLDEPEDGDAADVPGCRRLSLTWKVCNPNPSSCLLLFSVNKSLCVSFLPKMRTTATRWPSAKPQEKPPGRCSGPRSPASRSFSPIPHTIWKLAPSTTPAPPRRCVTPSGGGKTAWVSACLSSSAPSWYNMADWSLYCTVTAGFGAEEPRVTVHSNRSFTISLRDNLMGKYVCYSAEWMEPGHKAASMSYYSQDNSRTLTLKSEGTTLGSRLTSGSAPVEAE